MRAEPHPSEEKVRALRKSANAASNASRGWVSIRTSCNTKEPMWDLTREHAWHKAAAFAFALGASYKDVARQLGRSEPAVQNLARQKWFQKQVTRDHGGVRRKGCHGTDSRGAVQ